MIDGSSVSSVFRTEWPRLMAVLVRDTGDLDLAEDAAQEAFAEAAKRWPVDGRPREPGAWLLTTARRKAIDQVRRRQRLVERLPVIAAEHLDEANEAGGRPGTSSRHGLVDDQLALILGCCHPALNPDAQVALTLRAVGGLSTAQIARAFLVSEDTMGRRLGRAKTKIRAAGIPFGVIDRTVLDERVMIVAAVVYAIFTEGHASSSPASLVRGDLCDEALWLSGLLCALVPDDPEVKGLRALMLLTDSRRAARTDTDGSLLLLEHQDRSKWKQSSIAEALDLLSTAHLAHRLGSYQLQAAIAALHASAPSFAETKWPAIVGLFDLLLARNPDPVVGLNRAVAVAHASGPAAGLVAVDDLDEDALRDYPYLHSTRAEFLAQLGRLDEAAAAFERSLMVIGSDSERRHLEGRLAEVTAQESAPGQAEPGSL